MDNPAHQSGVAQFNHYAALSDVGIGLVVAGVITAAAAAAAHRWGGRLRGWTPPVEHAGG